MKPLLLIAAPSMKDPFFEKAVILIWHHDPEGALGVVINRPLSEAAQLGIMPRSSGISIADVLIVEDGLELGPHGEKPVNWGGPVDTDSGTLLTTEVISPQEGWILETGVAITRSQEALLRIIRSGGDLRLCLGYAGWGPGQLDRELADGSWLFTDPDPTLIFSENASACWEKAIQTLGIRPEWLLMTPIDA